MMKLKFTYKALTLLIGIAVAVIIMITLWLKPFSVESVELSAKPARQLARPAAKIVLERTYVAITEFLK